MEMLFTIKAAIARKQWRRYKRNWAKAIEFAVAHGVYVGATPLGYDRVDGGLREDGSTISGGVRDGRLVKNQHAESIERAYRMGATGAAWSEVARFLDAAGVPTATGRAAGGSTRWSLCWATRSTRVS